MNRTYNFVKLHKLNEKIEDLFNAIMCIRFHNEPQLESELLKLITCIQIWVVKKFGRNSEYFKKILDLETNMFTDICFSNIPKKLPHDTNQLFMYYTKNGTPYQNNIIRELYKITHINKDLLKIISNYTNGCCSCAYHIKQIPTVDIYVYSTGHDTFGYDIVECQLEHKSKDKHKIASAIRITHIFTSLLALSDDNTLEPIFVEKTDMIKFKNVDNFLNTTTYYSICNVINYPGIKETWYIKN